MMLLSPHGCYSDTVSLEHMSELELLWLQGKILFYFLTIFIRFAIFIGLKNRAIYNLGFLVNDIQFFTEKNQSAFSDQNKIKCPKRTNLN